MNEKFKVGDLVLAKSKPQWGYGRLSETLSKAPEPITVRVYFYGKGRYENLLIDELKAVPPGYQPPDFDQDVPEHPGEPAKESS